MSLATFSSKDIIQLIAQFLKENGLVQTIATLEKETNSLLSTVDNTDLLIENISLGKWDLVLETIKSVNLSNTIRQNLYEHIVFELVEAQQRAAAKILMRECCLQNLKIHDKDRYLHLERIITLAEFHPKFVYGDQDKQARRDILAERLIADMGNPIPPSRLLTLISNGIRWQSTHDPLFKTSGGAWDILKDQALSLAFDMDQPVTHAYATVPVTEPVEVVSFSPNGGMLATGSNDGIIEIWHPVSGKLRKDLMYQEEEKFMAMKSTILALNWSLDSTLLVSGSRLGQIKVWTIESGKCFRRFMSVHEQGVTTAIMNGSKSAVISGGFDGLIRSHGMQSGALLKEYRGHTSFLNSIVLNCSETRLYSGSSDGFVKIWDVKTGLCLKTITPSSQHQDAILHLHWIPHLNQIQINTRGRLIQRIDENGTQQTAVLCELSSQKSYQVTNVEEPVAWAITDHAEYTYMVTESGNLWTVTMQKKTVAVMPLQLDKVIGLVTCPGTNVVAVWTEHGDVSLWKP